MNDADLLLKLDRARWWAISQEPFYGSLAMAMADTLGNPHGQTACTDGRRIYWHREFLAKLTDEETRFVLLHETMHPAHGHLWRFPKPDQRTNIACDHAINLTLAEVKGTAMPKGGACDPAYKGLAEEEIYNRLPQNQPNGVKGQQDKGGATGDSDPCGGYTDPAADTAAPQKPAQKPGNAPGGGKTATGEPDAANGQETAPDSLQEQWQERVIQAAQAAKASGRGNIPADMQAVLDRVLAQKVDWRKEMADFVRDAVHSRNDWSRSARRMATAAVIYPRKRRDDLGLVVFAVDTSGSISNELCAEFCGLISAALADTGCRGVVLHCDTIIHAEHWIDPGGECPLIRSGSGGTDFAAPFARAEELSEAGERIAGLVYLTDGDGSSEPTQEKQPTLWLSTGARQMQTGRTVKIEG